MTIHDVEYKFIYVDIACNGRVSDGGVFKNCSIYEALNIPEPTRLPGSWFIVPYVLVADDAFALSKYLIKPYSQTGLTTEKRVLNYRLSRARRTVENAFGILANRFRVFMTPISLCPEKVKVVTLASCLLNNYLCCHATAQTVYTPPGSLDSDDLVTHELHSAEWRQCKSNGISLHRQGSNAYSKAAKSIQDTVCQYYSSEDGKIPWQYNMI